VTGGRRVSERKAEEQMSSEGGSNGNILDDGGEKKRDGWRRGISILIESGPQTVLHYPLSPKTSLPTRRANDGA
jgi:hypothetical protein